MNARQLVEAPPMGGEEQDLFDNTGELEDKWQERRRAAGEKFATQYGERWGVFWKHAMGNRPGITMVAGKTTSPQTFAALARWEKSHPIPLDPKSQVRNQALDFLSQKLPQTGTPRYKLEPRGGCTVRVIGLGVGYAGAHKWEVRITSNAVRFRGDKKGFMDISGCGRDEALAAVVHLIKSGWE